MAFAHRRSFALPLSFALILGTGLAHPREAAAFCGFYVAGADAELYNNATMVVLMRDGTRTVLSMANNYQGPPQDFAMVVPVPVVLGQDDVKVLPAEIFERVDALAAPRLVEYWEQDPCYVEPPWDANPPEDYDRPLESRRESDREEKARDLGVKIEAEFEVGEYKVVILSAKESTGLDTWLRSEKYNIPPGAQPLLDPYVRAGSKFFVAKVDAQKVQFDAQGMATLSPLRFHYDSDDFTLPIRLGLINASGPQDLLVHILARSVRYEVANYDNVAIPTNLEVKDQVSERFGQFYASLFDHTIAQRPRTVVTEYAWAANSCDPCPVEPLDLAELMTLGADVLPSYAEALARERVRTDLTWSIPAEFVLTRLHARYDASSLGEDLVFQAAPPILGGLEGLAESGSGAMPDPYGRNMFQARYIIRHPWEGPIECADPQRGRWGGPWPELEQKVEWRTEVARDLAFVERDAPLRELVRDSAIAQLEQVGSLPAGPIPAPAPSKPSVFDDSELTYENPRRTQAEDARGCAHCASVEREDGLGLLAAGFGLLGLLGLRRRRDRSRG